VKKKYIGTTKKLSFTIQFSKDGPFLKGSVYYSRVETLVNSSAFLFEKEGLSLLLLKEEWLRLEQSDQAK